MSAANGGEEVVALAFFAFVIVFAALGCVLLVYFWARRFGVTSRALIATGLTVLLFLLPMAALAGTGRSWFVLPIVAITLAIIAFPVAFLATRKLERRKRAEEGIRAVFD